MPPLPPQNKTHEPPISVKLKEEIPGPSKLTPLFEKKPLTPSPPHQKEIPEPSNLPPPKKKTPTLMEKQPNPMDDIKPDLDKVKELLDITIKTIPNTGNSTIRKQEDMLKKAEEIKKCVLEYQTEIESVLNTPPVTPPFTPPVTPPVTPSKKKTVNYKLNKNKNNTRKTHSLGKKKAYKVKHGMKFTSSIYKLNMTRHKILKRKSSNLLNKILGFFPNVQVPMDVVEQSSSDDHSKMEISYSDSDSSAQPMDIVTQP